MGYMERGNKLWLHYVKNIIAADVASAVFLASYLRYSGISMDYAAYLEVFDLQKYRVISKKSKVLQSLSRTKVPFVFIVGKN